MAHGVDVRLTFWLQIKQTKNHSSYDDH